MLLELFEIFANNIAPILIVASIGFIVGRLANVEPRPISQLIFNVFSPALVFWALYTSEVSGQELASIGLATIIFQFIMAGFAFALARALSIERSARASMMIGAFCLNAGNYGLSLVSFAFGPDVLARAIVVYITNTVVNYSLGVFVASSGKRDPLDSLKIMLRVPAIYAAIIALVLRSNNLELPLMIDRSASLLKDATIPLMLTLLGLQLSRTTGFQRLRLVAASVSMKLLIAPFVGLALALLLNFDDLALIGFVLQISMPTAVMTLILAKEYELDEALSLNIIMASTLLSPITLSVIILLLRQTTTF